MSLGLDEETAEKGVVLLGFHIKEMQFEIPPASPSELTSKAFRSPSDMLHRVDVIHTFVLGEAPKAFANRDMRHLTPEMLANMKAHFGKFVGCSLVGFL